MVNVTQSIGLLDWAVLAGVSGERIGTQLAREHFETTPVEPLKSVFDWIPMIETGVGFGINAMSGGSVGRRAGLDVFAAGFPAMNVSLFNAARHYLGGSGGSTAAMRQQRIEAARRARLQRMGGGGSVRRPLLRQTATTPYALRPSSSGHQNFT